MSRRQTQRLRPSQGGALSAPVYPATPISALTKSDAIGACTEGEPRTVALAIRNVPAPDWGEVAIDARARIRPRTLTVNGEKIPVKNLRLDLGLDEELERERARLVGKRPRYIKSGRFTGAAVASVSRDERGKIRAYYGGEEGGFDNADRLVVEPIPEEPARPRAVWGHEMRVGMCLDHGHAKSVVTHQNPGDRIVTLRFGDGSVAEWAWSFFTRPVTLVDGDG